LRCQLPESFDIVHRSNMLPNLQRSARLQPATACVTRPQWHPKAAVIVLTMPTLVRPYPGVFIGQILDKIWERGLGRLSKLLISLASPTGGERIFTN
jgi:hypothetical protein